MNDNRTGPSLERDWRPTAVALAMFVLVIASVAAEMIGDRRFAPPYADIVVFPPGTNLILRPSSYMPQNLGETLVKIPGVKAVSPVLVQDDGQGRLQQVWGIDPVSFDAVSGGLRYRKGVVFSAPDETVVDDVYAAGNRVQVGDQLKLLNGNFRISGIVEHGKGARVFTSLKAMQERTGLIDKTTLFYLKLNNPDDLLEVYERLQRELPDYIIISLKEEVPLRIAGLSAIAESLQANGYSAAGRN